MSYTTLIAVYPGDRMEELDEFSNSWRSAPLVWDWMGKKYLNLDTLRGGDHENVWALVKHSHVEPHDKAVLAMTFDRAYILAEDFAQARADIKAFFEDRDWGHWHEIASIMMEMEIGVRDPVPALGFHMTSVGSNPFVGEWDEENECYGPLDWATTLDVYAYLRDECDSKSGGTKNAVA